MMAAKRSAERSPEATRQLALIYEALGFALGERPATLLTDWRKRLESGEWSRLPPKPSAWLHRILGSYRKRAEEKAPAGPVVIACGELVKLPPHRRVAGR